MMSRIGRSKCIAVVSTLMNIMAEDFYESGCRDFSFWDTDHLQVHLVALENLTVVSISCFAPYNSLEHPSGLREERRSRATGPDARSEP